MKHFKTSLESCIIMSIVAKTVNIPTFLVSDDVAGAVVPRRSARLDALTVNFNKRRTSVSWGGAESLV